MAEICNRGVSLQDQVPFGFHILSEEEIGREKEKARKLKRTHWWERKIRSGACHYCGRIVGRGQLTMDHLIPLIRGGRSKKGNLVPACKECNNKKKYLLPVEWEQYLKRLARTSEDL